MAIDKLFFYGAIVGAVLFLAQLVLGLVGWGGDGADVDFGDPGAANGTLGHSGADASFKNLSLQGISAFVLMFGLVGLALRRDNGASPSIAVAGAVVAGTLATWVISRIFRFFTALQSKGNVDMQKALGAKATVYLTITKDKPGKVQVVVSGRLLTLEATTEDAEILTTGRSVVVTQVTPEQRLVVSAS